MVPRDSCAIIVGAFRAGTLLFNSKGYDHSSVAKVHPIYFVHECFGRSFMVRSWLLHRRGMELSIVRGTMEAQCKYRTSPGSTTEAPWQSKGYEKCTVGEPWEHHESPLQAPWKSNGSPMEAPRDSCSSTMAAMQAFIVHLSDCFIIIVS